MASKRSTQAQRIVEYIDQNGFITRLDSSNKLFIFELSSRIISLEKKGWVFDKSWVTKENQFGEHKRFRVYRIIKRGEL